MVPFKFVKVEEGKRKGKFAYFITDSNGGRWSFDPVPYGDGKIIYAYLDVPYEYELMRGTKKAIPFFKEVEEMVAKAVESYKIKKNLTPAAVKTFEEIIDEL